MSDEPKFNTQHPKQLAEALAEIERIRAKYEALGLTELNRIWEALGRVPR